jgi:hypothetical protein
MKRLIIQAAAASTILIVAGAGEAQDAVKTNKFPPRNFNDYQFRDDRAISALKAEYLKSGQKSNDAVARLIAEADEAISRGFYSVMSKKLTPKSGDKHDYMSIGIYWWPDETKPGGIPYIRHDGKINPEANNASFDKQSLTKMGSAVSLSTLAYTVTGEKKYSDFAVRQIRIWFIDPETKMNPNMNFGQAVPGVNDGRKDGIIEGLVFVHVSESATMLHDRKVLSDNEYSKLKQWYTDFLSWLLTSRIGKDESAAKNNHGTWYAVQTVCYALFTGQNREAENILKNYIRPRIEYQIDPYGKMPEELARTRPYHYSLYALNAFALLAKMGENAGIDLWNYKTSDGRGIRSAFDFVTPIIADPEKFAGQGSSGGEKQIAENSSEEAHFVTILRYASQVYNDTKYQDAADRLLDRIYRNEESKTAIFKKSSDRSYIIRPSDLPTAGGVK